ncbi:hypothetical protein Q2941_48365 [Bradyrhizobium sp. UFLA05-153]
MKAAKALGIEVPTSMQLLADEVIEEAYLAASPELALTDKTPLPPICRLSGEDRK